MGLENLSELFTTQPVQRDGGSKPIKRLLSDHLEHQRKRWKGGEISESTFVVYQKQTRHSITWFPLNGFKRLAIINRTSLLDYALNRTNEVGMSLNTANLEVVCLRMWWAWLQETEVVSRPGGSDYERTG